MCGEAERAGSERALPVVLSVFPLETVDGWPGLNSSARCRPLRVCGLK